MAGEIEVSTEMVVSLAASQTTEVLTEQRRPFAHCMEWLLEVLLEILEELDESKEPLLSSDLGRGQEGTENGHASLKERVYHENTCDHRPAPGLTVAVGRGEKRIVDRAVG